MRIYISATFSDLVEHRAAVARVLRQMGHDVIGMEEYVAEGMKPLQRCVADAGGADVCICIVAWRYGYVPSVPAATPPATPVALSITESEFRAAEGKRPLVFVLDSSAVWPAHLIDALTGDNENGARIKRFREDLLGSWLAGVFHGPEDLARQVSAAVHRREIRDRIQNISLTFDSQFADVLMAGGPVRDSTVYAMKTSLAAAPQLAVLRVDLKDGQYWWSTRLFFLACVAEEIAGTALLIFLEGGKKFVGAATPATVRDRLARGSALLKKFEQNCRKYPVDPNNLDQALHQRASEWDKLFAPQLEQQSRILVTTRELRRWLGSDLLRRGVEEEQEQESQDQISLSPALLKAIMDWPHMYVPVTSSGELRKVVNRAAFAEQLARMFIQDLERLSL
jgi:hypothetical protein